MLKKGIKLIIIILLLFSYNIVFNYNNISYAAQVEGAHGAGGGTSGGPSSIDVTEDLDGWSSGYSQWTGSSFTDRVKAIVSVVRTIGMIVSVITLSIIGIKFMLCSVEEKAQYKQTLIPWLIGAIMVFAISLIPSLLYSIAM